MTDRLLDITTGTAVCDLDHLAVESGAAALVDGEAVAVFRVEGDAVFALANYDPFSGASVLARGIVGSRGEVPTVASPMHKQVFDLRTGQCLDDAAVRVATYEAAVVEGRIVVGRRREPDA